MLKLLTPSNNLWIYVHQRVNVGSAESQGTAASSSREDTRMLLLCVWNFHGEPADNEYNLS